MKFHSAKMAEVNQLIREIWQQTYQGHDIDYIEIKSDIENAAPEKAAGAAPSRARSYTYRVRTIRSTRHVVHRRVYPIQHRGRRRW